MAYLGRGRDSAGCNKANPPPRNPSVGLLGSVTYCSVVPRQSGRSSPETRGVSASGSSVGEVTPSLVRPKQSYAHQGTCVCSRLLSGLHQEVFGPFVVSPRLRVLPISDPVSPSRVVEKEAGRVSPPCCDLGYLNLQRMPVTLAIASHDFPHGAPRRTFEWALHGPTRRSRTGRCTS
jgi:hypothetical protein